MKKTSLLDTIRECRHSQRDLAQIDIDNFDIHTGDFRNANALMYLLRDQSCYDKQSYTSLVDELIPLSNLSQLTPMGANCLSVAVKAMPGYLSSFAWRQLITQNLTKIQNDKNKNPATENLLLCILYAISLNMETGVTALDNILNFTEDKAWLLDNIETVLRQGGIQNIGSHPIYIAFKEKELLQSLIASERGGTKAIKI